MTAAEAPPPGPVAAPPDDAIDGRAILRGALVGLAVFVPVSILRVVLDREITDFDDSGWIYPLFVLILVGYGAAAWVAARNRPDTPYIHGILGAVGALALWIPLRVVIWAVREDNRKLFSGSDAALAPGQLFGQIVIAAGIGMLAGWLSVRLRRAGTEEPVP
jgi:hypothetical protein